MKLSTIITVLSLYVSLGTAQQACYRPNTPQTPKKSSCAGPDFWKLRDTLCSSNENWGEGFPFLSGRGLNLRLQDNCTVDGFPDGSYVSLHMTISSTVKDRDDCFNRTRHIIERCVDNGYPEFNGGEWYDLVAPDKTFIWMQYLYTDPTPVPCYPPYCPYEEEAVKARKLEDGISKRVREVGGAYIELDSNGSVLKRETI